MTTPKKLIPKFLTPTEQARQIDGQLVTVRRLPARRAPDVLSRLLGDVGAVVVEMLSSPDRELDSGIEGAIRSMIAGKSGADAGVDTTITIVKAIVFSDAIAKLKGFDFGWYVEQMLPKCMAIGGVEIDSIAELDESGILPRTLFEVFQFACEVNFFPTSAGRDTNVGSALPASTTQEPKKAPITGRSRLKGETSRAGRLAPT